MILFLLVISGIVGYVIGRGADEGGSEVVATQTGTGAGETAGGSETTTGGETTGGETTGGETTAGETTGGETTGGGGDDQEGAAVFASAGCGNCHTLEAANSSGTIGPNLDEAQPSQDEAEERIRNGGNGMPAFEGQLSDDEIEAVAAFVSAG